MLEDLLAYFTFIPFSLAIASSHPLPLTMLGVRNWEANANSSSQNFFCTE